MNEIKNSKKEKISDKDNQDIAALLAKMQHKLDSMEEKIDSLIRQLKQTTFEAPHFPKTYKPYDKTKRSKDRTTKGKKEEVSSEGKFYHGRPFGRKKDGGKSVLKRNKKPFKKSNKEMK
ncbi:MAG: hypothetical protein K8S27_04390 [Candidatus Omnitrophica bacterium]|nr:hypothetical protein [Candidatus Omnitrophota bacterium]